MSALRDKGWAKLNLTLEVLGRRQDGFHELKSLVAFAALGDELHLEPGGGLSLEVEGPFAHAMAGDNLILKAAKSALDKVPDLKLGRFHLTKLLPVAAGLGGGSADAAAALRLIARANPGGIADSELATLAAKIGSDVSVCLSSRPALISGRGEQVEPVDGFPACGMLLANPGIPLATAAVYAELGAADLQAPPLGGEGTPDFRDDFEQLIAYALPRLNGLEAPAARLVPEIREVLASLLALEETRLARLSGSGPTCFALFATEAEAAHGAAKLAREHPGWWIAAASSRG